MTILYPFYETVFIYTNDYILCGSCQLDIEIIIILYIFFFLKLQMWQESWPSSMPKQAILSLPVRKML